MKSILIALSLAGSVALFAGCGGEDKESGGDVSTPQVDANTLARAKGKGVFKQTCVACHGDDGRGIEGLGKDWTKSEYIANSTDDELVEFLKVGRTIEDPANTTGVLMPPKGGNPSLSVDDLRNVVVYMRSLQD
jgi:cytochrome c5